MKGSQMVWQRFFINKMNENSADTLTALGWAAMLQTVLRHLNKASKEIVLHNSGGSFEITIPCSLQVEELQREQAIPFLEPLITVKQDERQGKKGRILQDGFFYEREREKQKELSEQIKQLPAQLRTPDARLNKDPLLAALIEEKGVKRELAHYQAINMLKVPDTFNEIVLRWQKLSCAQQWAVIAFLGQRFSQPDNQLDSISEAWKILAKAQGIDGPASVTAVQVINPASGKGSNSTKSNRLTNGGVESFWLLELLKFKGFMLGAAPFVLRGSKDRKTYVILPETVELETLTNIMHTFRQICWSSSAMKQDILAALRLTQVLVRQRRTALTSRQGLEDFDPSPIVSIARGFDVTYYKDMGSAHATMNVSTINIPTWFPRLHTLSQVMEAELFLQEHLRLIRRIEGYQGKEGNNEQDLLRAYRDFLSGHDLRPFWTFATLYGTYLFRQREHEKDSRRWLPQLTTKGLEYLVMNHENSTNSELHTILTTPGFQRIASAIRESTVRAQRRRSQENDNTYEVRYGLGQELMRKVRYRNDFMAALSEFLFLYNAETAREEEKAAKRQGGRALTSSDYKKNKLRYPVTTADIDQLSALLDTHPTELVASMLVAYGYARIERVKPEELQHDEMENQETTPEEM